MILDLVTGLFWLAASLGLFVLAQRRLHREMQHVLLLVTRRPALALGIFSLIFFPGVVLHEASHFLMARLLLVRTVGFSLLPKAMPNRTLRLGYIETRPTDPLRDTLIGLAPLISGGITIAWLGTVVLGLGDVLEPLKVGAWQGVFTELASIPDRPDFWVWFFLTFTISSTMLPSPADRQSWRPVLLGLAIVAGLAVAAGAGTWMEANLAPVMQGVIASSTVVFSIGLILHILLAFPVWLLRLGLEKMIP